MNAGRGTSYNAVLTRDIDLGGEAWTPIGQYARYAYTGNFDGQGYTISRLKVTGSSSNHYGLFGVVGNGGVIRSLTVSGVVTITGSGNGTYGIGGSIGKLDAGKIEQCINEVVVSGNYNTGGTVGYLTNGGTVGQCINKASITGSYNVGGIVGQVNGAGEISH